MKLTDRKKSLVGPQLTDLIHIVKTADTTQNSAGSSYKIEMGDYKNFFSFNGGIVTGDTIFTGSISATTYLGLPLDVKVSGLTFNNGNYNLVLNQNDGSSFITNLGVLASDMNVTGGTYNANTGVATFTNNSGGTFQVTGFLAQDNNQKIITGNYTLTNSDNNFTILINNGVNPVTITVPIGLLDKLQVGFIQQGTGDVTFNSSGTTILTPILGAFKIKGQNYNAYLEKVGATNVFHLLGNLKV